MHLFHWTGPSHAVKVAADGETKALLGLDLLFNSPLDSSDWNDAEVNVQI